MNSNDTEENSNSLKYAISCWDEKSKDDIQSVYNNHCDDKLFIDSVTHLIGDLSIQIGATWLLKQHLEKGHTVNSEQSIKILQKLPKLSSWQSQLHILQIFNQIQMDIPNKTNIEHFIRHNLTSDNKFVRAWSYNGFYELARNFPEYTEEMYAFFDMAMNDESASIKARIRQLLKKKKS